jgi:glycosyltransferase involved in cell wall biosynthesis
MKNITLSSAYNFESGYNLILHTLLEYLPQKNIHIRPRSYSTVSGIFKKYFENISYTKEDCDLLLLPPCSEIDNTHPLFHLSSHKCRLFFTMWESTRTSDIFIDQLNKNKSIIVPNKWNKYNFQNQGCEVPIHVVPLFVDTDVFNYVQPSKSDVFVFGTANNDPRKRLYETVKCFLTAFPNEKDVILKVKTNNELPFKFLDDRIKITTEHYDKIQLKNWYGSLDVFVSGVSAEGWGLHQHESMVCGRPVIAANYAGLSEFMTQENSFCLNYDEIPSTGYWETPGGRWSKYDEEHMIETMKYCYNNRDIVYQKGKISSENVSKLNINNFINQISSVINIYTQ